jgi:hypothetical protein
MWVGYVRGVTENHFLGVPKLAEGYKHRGHLASVTLPQVNIGVVVTPPNRSVGVFAFVWVKPSPFAGEANLELLLLGIENPITTQFQNIRRVRASAEESRFLGAELFANICGYDGTTRDD